MSNCQFSQVGPYNMESWIILNNLVSLSQSTDTCTFKSHTNDTFWQVCIFWM